MPFSMQQQLKEQKGTTKYCISLQYELKSIVAINIRCKKSSIDKKRRPTIMKFPISSHKTPQAILSLNHILKRGCNRYQGPGSPFCLQIQMNKKINKNYFPQFNPDQHFKQAGQAETHILADRVDNVMKDKFSVLLDMYVKNAYQNGYNSTLAFRVIGLYLYCQFKPSDDQLLRFSLVDQVSRFISAEINKNDQAGLQKCMDLLMIKQLKHRAPQKNMKFWKIQVLAAIKKHYAANHKKKDKKKASATMRELCREQLKQQNIKHDQKMYTSIMDILVSEEKVIMNSKKAHGKAFEAIQNGNNIIRTLQKADQVIIPKYQQQLMMAYWEIAKLHYQLHYITYARKYAQTTLNIAERINDRKIAQSARTLLENLVAA